MKISRSSQIKSTFVLTANEIKKIHSLIKNYCGNVNMKIHCKDDLIREYNDVEELLEYENMKDKEIISMSFSSFGRDQYIDRIVSLSFESQRYSNVYISIEGAEDETIKLNEKIHERFEALRPWYSIFSEIEFIYVTFGIFFTLILLIILMSILGQMKQDELASTRYSFSSGFITASIPMVLGFLLNRLKKIIFPLSTFAINQGEKRFKNYEDFRKIFLGGLIVSILGSIILSFM